MLWKPTRRQLICTGGLIAAPTIIGRALAQSPILPGFPPGAFQSRAALDGAAAGPSTTTWNPADKDASITLSAGNLTATKASGSGFCGVRAVASASTGKKYWELTWTSVTAGLCMVGIADGTWNLTANFLGQAAGSIGWTTSATIFGASGSADSWTAGDVLSIALDIGGALIWFRRNASARWNASGSADPATGTGGISTSSVATPMFAAASLDATGDIVTANFGGSAYNLAAPSGFGNW